jgi:hypothetical protein
VRRVRPWFKKELLMSIKTKGLATAAALTVAGGLSTAATLPATASTTQCGSACVQIFSKMFGPGFVESAVQGIPAAGQPTIVHRASDSDPTGDFINPLGHPVLVSTFYAQGMVSAAVNAHYGPEPAVQVEYAPFGQPTGLCAAVATTAYQNEGLSLQPCGTPGHHRVHHRFRRCAHGQALLPDRQRLDHGLHPPVHDDHPR